MAKKIAVRGNGHIEKLPSGKYFVQVMIGTSADGKQIRKSKTCKTLKEAMKHRDDFLKLKSKNNAVAPSSSTLEDWVKKFLDDRKNDIAACSYDSYKYAGNRIIRDIGKYKIQKVSRKHIQDYIKKLSKVQKLKPSTVQHTYSLLRSVFKYAVIAGAIDDSPCNLIQLPKKKKVAIKVWTDEEVDIFKELIKGHRYECLFLLGLYGLRKSEVVGLQVEDVDLSEKTIHIQHQYMWHSTGQELQSQTKTDTSNRILPMTDEIIEMLKMHIGDRTTGHVFLTDKGTPLTGAAYAEAFRKLVSNIEEVKDLNLHKLRHVCASQMAAKNINPRTIADWLGHSQVNMTLDVYTHTNLDVLKQALEIIEK